MRQLALRVMGPTVNIVHLDSANARCQHTSHLQNLLDIHPQQGLSHWQVAKRETGNNPTLEMKSF